MTVIYKKPIEWSRNGLSDMVNFQTSDIKATDCLRSTDDLLVHSFKEDDRLGFFVRNTTVGQESTNTHRRFSLIIKRGDNEAYMSNLGGDPATDSTYYQAGDLKLEWTSTAAGSTNAVKAAFFGPLESARFSIKSTVSSHGKSYIKIKPIIQKVGHATTNNPLIHSNAFISSNVGIEFGGVQIIPFKLPK